MHVAAAVTLLYLASPACITSVTCSACVCGSPADAATELQQLFAAVAALLCCSCCSSAAASAHRQLVDGGGGGGLVHSSCLKWVAIAVPKASKASAASLLGPVASAVSFMALWKARPALMYDLVD